MWNAPLRRLLCEHYLDGRSQEEMAHDRGLSASRISQRLTSGTPATAGVIMPKRQLNQRDYYTTAEMAKAIGCAQQTLIRRMDAGIVPGYRVPGGRHRRCPKAVFRQYLTQSGIPTDMLDEAERRRAFSQAFRSTRDSIV